MTDSTIAAPAKRRGVPMWAQIIIWVVLLGLLAMVAVALRRTQQGTVQPGDKIPDFAMPLFTGYGMNGSQQVKLSNLRGKVVIINFWASWCKPCEQEAADLRTAWDSYKDTGKVVFVGVDYVDTEPEARAYLEKFGIQYSNGPDLGTKVSQLFRIKGVPETYFIDQQGVLRRVQVGPFTSVDDIKAVIDPMLR
ncbi:MAG TPA: TlpA disulfide reductase family protein [Anaerolineales bacterium]|nr:TlpA disulfide reductase family protein [Anaerolineales bacterium]